MANLKGLDKKNKELFTTHSKPIKDIPPHGQTKLSCHRLQVCAASECLLVWDIPLRSDSEEGEMSATRMKSYALRAKSAGIETKPKFVISSLSSPHWVISFSKSYRKVPKAHLSLKASLKTCWVLRLFRFVNKGLFGRRNKG